MGDVAMRIEYEKSIFCRIRKANDKALGEKRRIYKIYLNHNEWEEFILRFKDPPPPMYDCILIEKEAAGDKQ